VQITPESKMFPGNQPSTSDYLILIQYSNAVAVTYTVKNY